MKKYKTLRFLSGYSVFFAFLISLLFMLPTFNKFWAPEDEGIILEASYMVGKGMIPYRDFYILMYPPGQIYTIAALFKIFGMKLAVPRIYTIFMQSVISACVFYIVKKMAPLKYAAIAFVLCLITLTSAGWPIPRPMWPGIAFSLLSTAFILNFIDKEKLRYLSAAGFFLGITVMFRHDIGFLTFVPGLIGLGMFSIYKSKGEKNTILWSGAITKSFRLWAVYAFFPFVFVAATGVWLYRVNALPDAFNALLVFPREFLKGASIPFPKFCFDFTMIIHRGCYFIRKNQFYIPIVMNFVAAGLLLTEMLSKKKLDKRIISLTVLFSLGIFYLQQVVVRTDTGHLAGAFPPIAILFGIMFTHRAKYKNIFFRAIKVLAVSFISLLMALFCYRNIERYFKDTYRKVYMEKTIKPVAFKQGTLYVPDDGRDMLLYLLEYARKNTRIGETIYVGNLNHAVPQLGWFELIYFLSERLPAVRYYEIHPGLQDKEDIQKEMILSLEQNKTGVLFLRDYKSKERPPGPLDRYIRKEYKLDKIVGSYHIYAKR